MKKEILGVLRHILTTAGGYLIATGAVDAATVEVAAGAIVTLIGVGWSIYEKRSAG